MVHHGSLGQQVAVAALFDAKFVIHVAQQTELMSENKDHRVTFKNQAQLMDINQLANGNIPGSENWFIFKH